MATERLPVPAPTPTIPADPDAAEHYRALKADERAALDGIIADAQQVAAAQGAELYLAWWVDEEVEDWGLFVIRAVVSEPAREALWAELAAVGERSMRSGSRDWVLRMVSFSVSSRSDAA